MTVCNMRDKPFDVLTENTAAGMMSVGGITRLAKECEVKKKKKVTHSWREAKIRRKLWLRKIVHWNFH